MQQTAHATPVARKRGEGEKKGNVLEGARYCRLEVGQLRPSQQHIQHEQIVSFQAKQLKPILKLLEKLHGHSHTVHSKIEQQSIRTIIIIGFPFMNCTKSNLLIQLHSCHVVSADLKRCYAATSLLCSEQQSLKQMLTIPLAPVFRMHSNVQYLQLVSNQPTRQQ